MSKPAAKPLLLLLAAIVAYYWKIVFTRRFSMITDFETVSQAYSWFDFWAQSIRHGVWPLWDPYMFGGRSLSGEMQTGAFYPLHLVFALFGPDRNGLLPERLYHAYFVFAHMIAAVCMFALVRELELSYFSAVVAGLCFSVGGFMGQVPWPHLLESAGWTPLIFLLALRAWKATGRRALVHAALAGLVLGLSILAGGLHIVFMQAILLAAAAVYQAFRHGREDAVWPRPLVLAAITLMVGLAAGAVQLAPSVEYSVRAVRFLGGTAVAPASQKIPYAKLDDVPLRVLASYVLFSNPTGLLGGVEVLDPYEGVLPLLLAVIGFWKCRGNPWVRFSAGLALAAFLYSLGRGSWLYGTMYALVPFLWMAREASRFLFLAHFALVILAAYGSEAFFSARQKLADWKTLNRVYLCFAVICGLALISAAFFETFKPKPWIEMSLLMIPLTYILFRWIAGGAVGLAPRLLTVGLIVFNLSAFSYIAPNKLEVARKGIDYSERLRGLRGVADFLRGRPGLFRARVLVDPGLNMGDAYAIQTLNGGAVTMATNYYELMNQPAAGPRLLSNRYIVRPASVTEPNPIYADKSWKIYEDPQALPRAWVVHETTVEPSHERLLERLAASDLPHAALIGSPLPVALEPQTAGSDQAIVTSYAGQKIAVQVNAASQGLLILSEMYYPGWVARVNGTVQPIYEVDGGLRGIIVPAGANQVVLDYAPRSVRVGALLTALAFLGTLLLWKLQRHART